jgi:hypothetical protein
MPLRRNADISIVLSVNIAPNIATLLRGFRVSVSTLDAFLVANSVDETHGLAPFYQKYPDKDYVSIILHSNLGPEADPQKMAREEGQGLAYCCVCCVRLGYGIRASRD